MGRIKTRTYQKQDGSTASETYVMADRVQFLSQKNEVKREEPKKQETDPFQNVYEDFGNNVVNNDMDDFLD
jgi:single-stranded DNA-binding protein